MKVCRFTETKQRENWVTFYKKVKHGNSHGYLGTYTMIWVIKIFAIYETSSKIHNIEKI